MSQLFFFTLRDTREASIAKYSGLLPKLSNEWHDADRGTVFEDIIGYDYETIVSEKSQKDYFRRILNSPNNSLKKSRYIEQNDIDKIIQLNLELFDENSMTKEEYKGFLEHLYMSHSDMEYGIYMGARKADSEREFLNSVHTTFAKDPNQTLLFYINAEKLIKHIDQIRNKHRIQSTLMYFNTSWQYGIFEGNGTSILYDGNNFYDFMCHLRSFTNEELRFSETIVQIPLPVELFNHTFISTGTEAFLYGGKKKKTKNVKKTLKKKRILQKKEKIAKKYIDLLNLALKHIHMDNSLEIFDKHDYLLYTSNFLETGIKQGYKFIHRKDIVIEADCNSMCMTISMLNYGLIDKDLKKLNILEKLYLFFLSYLQTTDYNKKDNGRVDFEYALRKADNLIQHQKNKFQQAVEKDGMDHRRAKQYKKNVERFEKKKQLLIDNQNTDIPEVRLFYRINKCDNIDCEYLNSYHMKKSEKHFRSYEKFCRHLPFLFKGIIWLNMYQHFGKIKSFNPFKIPINKEELVLNIDIRKSASGPLKDSIIFIPTEDMFKDFSQYTKDEIKYYFDDNTKLKEFWVYGRLNDKKKTIQKIDIKKLPNKYFIAPLLFAGDLSTSDYKDHFIKFIVGSGQLPKLTKIKKTSRNIGGKMEKDLQEYIENSITIHWVVVHKNKLRDYIQYLLTSYF